MPNAPANATPSAPTSAVPGSAAAAPARSEEVVVTTDVLRLTFDTMGAQLVRAELLKYPATGQADKPTVLLDRSAGLNYVAQTGVVGARRQSFPAPDPVPRGLDRAPAQRRQPGRGLRSPAA